MGIADRYSDGDWNAVCGFCGRKRKASMLERNWQGLMVCPEHNPPRQPQDFVRVVPDDPSTPWAQRYGTPFVDFCTANGVSAVPGYALPGCATPGYSSPAFNPLGDPN